MSKEQSDQPPSSSSGDKAAIKYPFGRHAPGKYNATRSYDGYASVRESVRARKLRVMERAGLISDLREQVTYELIPTQYGECGSDLKRKVKQVLLERSCRYVADFVYTDVSTGKTVVEDCKGMRTREYIIKRKLMLFMHGIRIKET